MKRTSRGACLTLASVGCALAIAGSAVAEPERRTLSLPAPVWIAVELAPEVSPRPWLEGNGLARGSGDHARVYDLPDESSLLSFPIDPDEWQRREGELCAQEGVRSCEVDLCRELLAPGDPPEPPLASGEEEPAAGAPDPGVSPGQSSTPDPGATPDAVSREGGSTGASSLPDDATRVDPTAQTETATGKEDDSALIVGRLSDVGSTQTPRVALVRTRPSLLAALGLIGAAADLSADPTLPGQTRCPSEEADFPAAFPREAIAADGSFAVSRPDGPGRFDPGCWEVVVTDRCSSRSTPLRELTPEYEPGRLLALLVADPAVPVQATAQAIAAALGLNVLEVIGLASIDATLARFEIPDPGLDTLAVLAALAARPDVSLAQREFRYRASTGGYDDPRNFLNYGPPRIGADRLHPRTRAVGVTVAVIDSGVDATHPDLEGRVVDAGDTTGFGLSADVHGTAVAGIVAARENNGIGAYGVAPGAGVRAIKACQPEEEGVAGARCWSSTVAKALDRAIASDARVINLSLAGPQDPLVARLIESAGERGQAVVASAGNGGPDARPAYPAALPSVLAVTAIDAADELYAHATRGDFVDVAAPGVQVVAMDPARRYPLLSGTSMAAAHASGALALLLGIRSDARPEALLTSVRDSAIDLGEPGSDGIFGHGRLDVCQAVRRLSGPESGAAADPEEPCSAPTEGASTGTSAEPPGASQAGSEPASPPAVGGP